MSEFRQGVGTFTAGGNSYASQVVRATVKLTTQTETIPATLALDEEDEVGGALKRMFELEILESRADDGLWAEFKAAYESADQELAIVYRTENGAISTDNPEYQFTIRVTNLQIAPNPVGKIRQQTLSFPIKRGTYVEDTTP